MYKTLARKIDTTQLTHAWYFAHFAGGKYMKHERWERRAESGGQVTLKRWAGVWNTGSGTMADQARW